MAAASPSSVPASSFRSDSGNLDLVRAVAVSLVLFTHVAEAIWGRQLVGWRFGQLGVLMFFVHTSFVLMLSLERSALTGRAVIGAFYLRRAFRVYPLSMLCVTIVMVFNLGPSRALMTRQWTWPEYLSNMALTTNLTFTTNMVGGLWTLPLEVQMYLALPALYMIGRTRPRGVLFAVWLLSIPLALLQMRYVSRLNVLGYAPCFIAGVIGWELSLSARRRLPGWTWPIAVAAATLLFLPATHENDMYLRWVFCLALGFAIPWFREITLRPVTRALHVIAKYSYGIYLSHVAILLYVLALPVSMAVRWALCIAALVVTPVLLYHLIEHPMIVVGQRLARWLFPADGRRESASIAGTAPAP